MLLWKLIADESAVRCCTSANLDFKKVEERVKHEGLSFLTITLPKFGEDFEKSLDQGSVALHLFSGFRKRGRLPLFLGGFSERVFDRRSGELLDHPCIDAILAIRQLSRMFGKISLPCSDARYRRAMLEYVKCEKEVRDADASLSTADKQNFRRVSAMLFQDLFTAVDRSIYYMETVLPKHGPGATADKLSGNRKWNQRSWPVRLEEVFSASEILLPNWSYYDQLKDVNFLEPGSEIPVKVIAVPKTLKSPRIIGIEPTAMQYAQQTILPMFVNGIERNDTLSNVIRFESQIPNQESARMGSLSGSLATLDLSEASDRVSNQLVREMMHRWPHLHAAVDASRSRKADVPGHGVIRLAKYASMGSGLCFPVEMMVFTTLIFLGIEQSLGSQLSRSDIRKICQSGEVRVYGDDIIVPVDHVRSVVRVLEHFGAQVNADKSFWTGRFRESCGKEYYSGHDVSIVKVRHMFPTQRRDATGVISLVSLRNQLYFAGYWKTCQWLDSLIRKLLRYFPVVEESSPVLGRHSFLPFREEKFDEHLHSPLVKGYVVSAEPPKDPLDGPGALLKCLLKLEIRDQGIVDLPTGRKMVPYTGNLVLTDHLERSGRPRAVNIKLRWASPF